MPALRFDDSKSFDENLEAFLTYMDELDSELGVVLRVHIDQLRDAYDERSRKDSRTRFNDGVLASLNELLADNEEGSES
jgi:uncharacterized SAM-dependent methyltransferase